MGLITERRPLIVDYEEPCLIGKQKHYDNGKDYDVIDFIRDYDLNFCRGNIVKYITRAGKKDNEMKDLLKAKDYLDSQNLDFKNLLPIIEETAVRLKQNNPRNVQTGPAKRGDDKIISKHISQLTEDSKTVYTVLSSSIKKTHSND